MCIRDRSYVTDLVDQYGFKRIGSAQYRKKGAFLQHGEIQLNPPRELWIKVFEDEAPPNIVDATTNMGGGSVGTSGSGKLASSVPNISASNSDNNFTLYSKTQYNVLA